MIYVAGIDIGSAFSKAVVMSKNKIIAYQVLPSGGDYKLAAAEVTGKALGKAKLSLADIGYTVATGYGAANVSFANEVVSDISAGGRGVSYLFPSARTVVDIGGQFTKVFKVDEGGKPTAFLLSLAGWFALPPGSRAFFCPRPRAQSGIYPCFCRLWAGVEIYPRLPPSF